MAQRDRVEDFYNEYPNNIEEDPWYDGFPEDDFYDQEDYQGEQS